MPGAASGTLMMGSSERMRVPIGIIRVAMSPLPFPGTSRSVYIRSVEELEIFVYDPFDPIFEWRMFYHILPRIEDDIGR